MFNTINQNSLLDALVDEGLVEGPSLEVERPEDALLRLRRPLENEVARVLGIRALDPRRPVDIREFGVAHQRQLTRATREHAPRQVQIERYAADDLAPVGRPARDGEGVGDDGDVPQRGEL